MMSHPQPPMSSPHPPAVFPNLNPNSAKPPHHAPTPNPHPTQVRRYVMTARVADESRSAYVNVFNAEAETLLGLSADRLAELKDEESENKCVPGGGGLIVGLGRGGGNGWGALWTSCWLARAACRHTQTTDAVPVYPTTTTHPRPHTRSGYAAALKCAEWTDWVARVQTRTREYQGELSMRCSIASLRPMDYAQESRSLVTQIQGALAAAK